MVVKTRDLVGNVAEMEVRKHNNFCKDEAPAQFMKALRANRVGLSRLSCAEAGIHPPSIHPPALRTLCINPILAGKGRKIENVIRTLKIEQLCCIIRYIIL